MLFVQKLCPCSEIIHMCPAKNYNFRGPKITRESLCTLYSPLLSVLLISLQVHISLDAACQEFGDKKTFISIADTCLLSIVYSFGLIFVYGKSITIYTKIETDLYWFLRESLPSAPSMRIIEVRRNKNR